MAKPRTLELRWPALGVARRHSHERSYSAVSYPTLWSSNVRLTDPIARRLRGGSRQGLTKLISDDFGTTIADMVPIAVSSAASGAEELLVVLVDSKLGVVDDGVLSTVASAPASGFLVAGQQHAFVITTSAIVKFDPKTVTFSNIVATEGAIPTNCTFGAVYRDCLYLAGADNAIYKSGQGDFSDWGFDKDISDVRRAVAFQLSLASEVGPLPTALIPVEDKVMLAASARTLWRVQGSPVAGGSLERLSPDVGIISSHAWCEVGNSIVFLAEDGLYQVSKGGGKPESLTEERIPDELRDIDTSTYTPMLGYDHDGRAIHIYLPTTAGAAATDTHWLFEMESPGFWPMHVQTGHSPLAVCQYEGDLLLAGSDGYVRKTTGSDDDGTSIQSHVVIGPLQLGGPNQYGLVQTIHGIIGASSGTVYWRLIVADTAEKATDNAKLAIEAFQAGNAYSHYVARDGEWSAGRSYTAWPRTRGAWGVLWLQSTARWAYESVLLEAKPWGRIR